MFREKVMIKLGTFLCLLGLKRLCEWLLEMSAYFNNHLILCYFKVFYFYFLTVVHMRDTKVFET